MLKWFVGAILLYAFGGIAWRLIAPSIRVIRERRRFTAGEDLEAGATVYLSMRDGKVYNAVDEMTRRRRENVAKDDPTYVHRKGIDDALFGGKLLP